MKSSEGVPRGSNVTHPLATRWSWLLVVISGKEAADPRSTVMAVVSVVLAEQVSIIHGRRWRSSIADDCFRHSGASSCDLGERRPGVFFGRSIRV